MSDANETRGIGTPHATTNDARTVRQSAAAAVGEKVHQIERAAVQDGVVIAGDADQIAEETKEVSPEGLPGDPKTGPSGIRLEILFGYAIILCFGASLALWVNIPAGIAAMVIGTLAIVLNPVVGAASQRAQERESVMEQHKPDDPDAIVIRTTSKRKEERMARAGE